MEVSSIPNGIDLQTSSIMKFENSAWSDKVLIELKNKKEKLCLNPNLANLFSSRHLVHELIFFGRRSIKASSTGETQRAWLSLLLSHSKGNHFFCGNFFVKVNNRITNRTASLKSFMKPWRNVVETKKLSL